MFWLNTKRVIKGGFVNFWRNAVVSLSSILVMVIALFMIGSTVLLSAFLNSSLAELKAKVDINVYLTVDAQEKDILSLKSSIENLPEVATVGYSKKEQVLDSFRTRHENDQLTLQALEELGENPFGAILNIQAKDPEQYGAVAKFLEEETALSQNTTSIIDKINYQQNKKVIEQLSKIIKGVQKLGFIITVVLIVISILITFNTIRLAIYISREEISVMRLVGAKDSYIRGPFITEGILYGIVAALITIGMFYPVSLWIRNGTQALYGGIDMFQYYVSNFTQIFTIMILSGIALGAISSYLAVRKYLGKQ